MARVTAVVPDLLFGSKVVEQLTRAGHEVALVGAPPETLEATDVLVVDLGAVDPAAVAGRGTRVLGFYSHVDVETRRRAEAAGLDLVVARSRMHREGAELVSRLAATR